MRILLIGISMCYKVLMMTWPLIEKSTKGLIYIYKGYLCQILSSDSSVAGVLSFSDCFCSLCTEEVGEAVPKIITLIKVQKFKRGLFLSLICYLVYTLFRVFKKWQNILHITFFKMFEIPSYNREPTTPCSKSSFRHFSPGTDHRKCGSKCPLRDTYMNIKS